MVKRALWETLRLAADPSQSTEARFSAVRTAREAFEPGARAKMRTLVEELGEDDVELALDHLEDKALFGACPFRGTTEGEALRWLGRIFRNKLLDLKRRRAAEERRLAKAVETAAPETAPRSEEAIAEAVRAVRDEIVEGAAGVDLRNYDVFAGFVRGESTPNQMARFFPDRDSRKARNLVYKARERGRELARAAGERLVAAGSIDDEVWAWIVGDP